MMSLVRIYLTSFKNRVEDEGAMKNYISLLAIFFLVSVVLTLITIPEDDSHRDWLVKSKMDLRILENAVILFKLDNLRIPSKIEGLDILTGLHKETTLLNSRKYIDILPKDVWGNKYMHRTDRGQFYIYSVGPDGVDGRGMGDDVELRNDNYDCHLYNDCNAIKDYTHRIFSVLVLFSLSLIVIILVMKHNTYVKFAAIAAFLFGFFFLSEKYPDVSIFIILIGSIVLGAAQILVFGHLVDDISDDKGNIKEDPPKKTPSD